MAVPTTDGQLVPYCTNFKTRGTAAPEDFALTPAQMTQFSAVADPYIEAVEACVAGGRSEALVVAKSDAKAALLPVARELYGLIKSSLTVTNENKSLIGVHVDDVEPSPRPPVALAPLVSITSVIERTVRGRARDASVAGVRRRPPNAAGLTVLSHVGPVAPPPGDPGWRLEGQSGSPAFTIEFPSSVGAGESCWVMCLWYNARGEFSPPSVPQRVYLQVGPVAEAA